MTSPLPRECSTTELHRRKFRYGSALSSHLPLGRRICPAVTGAGEGNRTLVISLEGFCSTIELHPQHQSPSPRESGPPSAHSQTAFASVTWNPAARHAGPMRKPRNSWWRGKDSNLRRQSRQIYSLIPLTAREPLRTKPLIMRSFSRRVNVKRRGRLRLPRGRGPRLRAAHGAGSCPHSSWAVPTGTRRISVACTPSAYRCNDGAVLPR